MTSEITIPSFQDLIVRLPGISQESKETVKHLLEKNHHDHHLYFNKDGFHNHLVHHLLTSFALGANSEFLEKTYKEYDYLRERGPQKNSVTTENWDQFLGDAEMWTSYLDFFDVIVKEKGIQAAVEEYGFNEKMIPRLAAGALHPLIHLGFGIEFEDPIIVAEGLAATAIHKNKLEKIIDKEFMQSTTQYKPILDILNQLRNDSRARDFLEYDESNKFQKGLDRRGKVIREYAEMLELSTDMIEARYKELYQAAILVYAATAQRPDKSTVRLDFFFMHFVTSAYFLDIVLGTTQKSDLKVQIMKAYFVTFITYYLTRGAPALHVDLLEKYESKRASSTLNPWLQIVDKSFDCPDVHVMKTVRSLMKADMRWTGGENDIYLKAAQLTIDNVKDVPDWSMNGLGFVQEWENHGKS